MKIKELIEKEIRGCFDFFYNETNWDKESCAYGLTSDLWKGKYASIAATGYNLCALIIGAKRGYISYEEAEEKTYLSLKSIYENVSHYNGFMTHFINFLDGCKKRNSEYSTIDTSIFLCGAVCSGSFFKGRVQELTDKFIERCDFDYLVYEKNGKKCFEMSIEEDESIHFGVGKWDYFAEQIMMYILYAGKESTSIERALDLYYGFNRPVGAYKGENFVYCFNNSLFIHQFTQCFFDFSKYVDQRGFDWFLNSKHATIANYKYCIDQKWSKTYNESSWGLTSCMTNKGYRVYGSKPNGYDKVDCVENVDGTVASYGPLCSINFTEELSLNHLKYAYSIEELVGKYGLYDSYNFENGIDICKTYVGIDKGPTLIMLDNYENETIWNCFMSSDYVKRAIRKLKFQEKN